MEVKITSVYDEGALENTQLIGAKGFSVLIEADGRRVLMDTGLRDRYLVHNLEYLDVDPESVEAVVITQGHPDNCRALDGFLGMRETPVKVYAPAGLYDGKKGFFSFSTGLSEDNRAKADLDVTDGWFEPIPGVTVTPFLVNSDGWSERFVATSGRRLTVVSGRGVGGPARALDAVADRFGRSPEAFLGAVLLEKKKKPLAEQYASDFSSRGCDRLILNHCTGRDGMVNLRTHFGLNGIEEFYVGMTYRG